MSLPLRNRPHRPWLPWAKAGVALLLVGAAGYGLLEAAQRYLGLQKLTIEQVMVTGCRGEHQAEVRKLAEKSCLHKPLFWFDADGLRESVEGRRWVRGLLIRKDPPDRLTLVVEERKPLLWLVRPQGTFLISEEGVVMDRLSADNMVPLPVVADPGSQDDKALAALLNAARTLRDKQEGFFEHISELRWTAKGPTAYIEGFQAPIYLSRHDVTNNIPNFQAIYVSQLRTRPDFAKITYVDLRWGDNDYIATGSAESSQTPPREAR